MNRAVKFICYILVFGIAAAFAAVLSFFLLYNLKSEFGIDIFPKMHLRDVLEDILSSVQGGA